MRIVGGKYRHRNIIWPEDNINIRPTKDRIREAIFSALGDISNLTVLDLFGGSGAMGIESVSRAANLAYIVDNNKIALNTITANVENLKINNIKILFMDAFDALNKFKNENVKFDLVFLDPPYEKGEYEKIISFLLTNPLLNENAVIVVERNRTINYDSFAFKSIKDYHYGDIIVDIIRL